MITLTRIYRFSASHRLHSRLLTDEENANVFGKCNNPYGHGHDYVLSVTVSGKIDERTGLLLNIRNLDALVEAKALNVLSHRNINVDVPHFANLVPTTENVVLFVADLLRQGWKEFIPEAEVKLARIHLQETDRNGFEVTVPAMKAEKGLRPEESLVHA